MQQDAAGSAFVSGRHYAPWCEPLLPRILPRGFPFGQWIRLGLGRHGPGDLAATNLGHSWEELARTAVARLEKGLRCLPAQRWWGNALDRKRMELDILAESVDGQTLLAGEAKLSVSRLEWKQRCDELHAKIARLPFASKYRQVVPTLFVAEGKPIRGGKVQWISANDVLSSLK